MHRRITLISLLLFFNCFFFETAHTASASSIEWVQKAYIAYYGRPGDLAGVEYWAGRLDDSGGNLSSIIDAFGNSQEFTNNYGSLTNDHLINTIYQQMFNRDPDPAGKEWYLGQLNSGAMTLQSITLNVLGGAQGDDLTIINNKLAVAAYFTGQLESSGVTYKSVSDAKYLLSLVDETAASVENAKSDCDVLLANWVSNGGTSKINWYSYDEGLTKSAAEQKKVFLFFCADWCHFCKEMGKNTFTDQEIIDYLNENFISVMVNADMERILAGEYFVRGLPATFFLTSAGDKIQVPVEENRTMSDIPGFISLDTLIQLLQYINTESYTRMTFEAFTNAP